MNLNTLVKLPDGRVGRTVWHNLDGYGIRFGEELCDPNDIPPPDAMLREPYSCPPTRDVEFVGEQYEVLEAIR